MRILHRDLGSATREERQIAAFNRVRLDGIGQVSVVLGEEERVVVEAPSSLLESIATSVDDGTLELGLDWEGRLGARDVQIRFEVTARDLRGVAIDGSGSIDVPQIAADSFAASIDGAGRIAIDSVGARCLHLGIDGAGRLEVAHAETDETRISIDGSGTVQVGRIESRHVKVSVDGMGRVSAAGAAHTLEVGIDGTGEARLADLRARSVEVTIDGVGKVQTWAEETLDVRVDGFARVEYSGSPQIRERSDGACSIVRRAETTTAAAESDRP